MDNQLTHHGIKGMRWGRRRYQNEDGSLTSAGRTRVKRSKDMNDEELTSVVRRISLENTYNKLTKQPSPLEKKKKLIDSSANAVSQLSKMNKETINNTKKKEKLDLSNMTDQEMREKINRYSLERQYSDMFAKETVTISKGQKFTSNLLDVAGTTLAVGGSALGIALAIKELRN